MFFMKNKKALLRGSISSGPQLASRKRLEVSRPLGGVRLGKLPRSPRSGWSSLAQHPEYLLSMMCRIPIWLSLYVGHVQCCLPNKAALSQNPPLHTHRRHLMASVLLEFSRTQAPLSQWLQETNHPQYLQTNSSSFSLWPALVSPPKPADGKKWLLCHSCRA